MPTPVIASQNFFIPTISSCFLLPNQYNIFVTQNSYLWIRFLQQIMENNQSFWQFSDQLRLQTSNFANLSLNDSIWSNSYVSKRRDERINFDIKVGGEINSFKSKESASDFKDNMNGSFLAMTYNNNLNLNHNNNNILGVGLDAGVGLNGGFNKGIYSKPAFSNLNTNINLNINPKGHKGKAEDDLLHPPKSSKKNNNPNKKHDSNNSPGNNDNGKDSKAAADKRFKTLPPSESLPRNETIGGYIFVCNNDTMAENLKRQLFGMFWSSLSFSCYSIMQFYAVCDVTYFRFCIVSGIESLNW